MGFKEDLFPVDEAEYGKYYQKDVLDLYQHYVESAEKISDRRHQANSLFLSINTVLLAVTSDLVASSGNWFVWVAALAGIFFSYFWRKLIQQYRSLNTAKFQVAHLIEQRLPVSPYKVEWDMLESGKNEEVHTPLTKVESAVPLVFMVLHGFVFAMGLGLFFYDIILFLQNWSGT